MDSVTTPETFVPEECICKEHVGSKTARRDSEECGVCLRAACAYWKWTAEDARTWRNETRDEHDEMQQHLSSLVGRNARLQAELEETQLDVAEASHEIGTLNAKLYTMQYELDCMRKMLDRHRRVRRTVVEEQPPTIPGKRVLPACARTSAPTRRRLFDENN
jgi:septal ring factor EnvC (AmiA/AmiB activator)